MLLTCTCIIFISDINLFNCDGKDNEFSEKLKQEKIIELEAEVEKVKNLVYKNPDNFYILNYSIEIFDTSTEGMFKIINSYIPSASPSIISKTITNTSSNISITGTSEPYLCTITDSDVTTANFVRLYPLDEDTETWLNDNTSSSIITESSGKFTFKVTTNTLPQTFTMKYFIQ